MKADPFKVDGKKPLTKEAFDKVRTELKILEDGYKRERSISAWSVLLESSFSAPLTEQFFYYLIKSTSEKGSEEWYDAVVTSWRIYNAEEIQHWKEVDAIDRMMALRKIEKEKGAR